MSPAVIVPTERDRSHLATVLATIAGFVDAIGFLALFGVFMSHMSGNTAAAGADLGAGSVPNVVERAVVIPVFVASIAGADALVEALHRRQATRVTARMLLLEAAVLLAFLAAGELLRDSNGWVVNGWKVIVVAALGTTAIGVQNALVRRIGSVAVHTTYVSGVLNGVAIHLVQWRFAVRDLRARPNDQEAEAARAKAIEALSILCPVFLAFFVGAAFGGYLISHLDLWVLVLPVAALATLSWVTWRWDERPQP